jgi:hypothetical protein
MCAMRIQRPRRLLLAGAALFVLVAAAVTALVAAAGRSQVHDLLPNLAAATPDDLSGRTGGSLSRPRFFLGFESAAANLGDGPLIVVGRRGRGEAEMRLRQRVERSDGSARTVPLRATLQYVHSRDHAHWHVRGFMRYQLRSAAGTRVADDRKTGFCLGDRYRAAGALPDRAPNGRYRDRCGRGAPGLTTIVEGISIGWGDNYVAHLEGQELELTGLPAGRYVLVHRVNPTRDVRETDFSDNVASMSIDLSWPRGGKLPPAIDVVARCPRTPICP